MPARSNITVNDGKATPVAHTFNPSGETSDLDMFEDRVGGIPIGYPSIVFRFKAPTRPSKASDASVASRVYKLGMDVALPTLESTSAATGTGIPPAPTVAYVHRWKNEAIMPERGTLAERKDIYAFNQNLLAQAFVQSFFRDLDPIW